MASLPARRSGSRSSRGTVPVSDRFAPHDSPRFWAPESWSLTLLLDDDIKRLTVGEADERYHETGVCRVCSHLYPTAFILITAHTAAIIPAATHRLLCSLYRENKLRCSVTFLTASEIERLPSSPSTSASHERQRAMPIRDPRVATSSVARSSLCGVDTLNLQNPARDFQIYSSTFLSNHHRQSRHLANLAGVGHRFERARS